MPNESRVYTLFPEEEIWHPGVPYSHASLTRAARYGDGLFETFLIPAKADYALGFHAKRLAYGIETLGLDLQGLGPSALLKSAAEHARNMVGTGTYRVRLQVSRVGNGGYGPEDDRVDIFMEISQLKGPSWVDPDLHPGLSAAIYPDLRLNYSALSGVKSCSALPYILAARHAKANGVDEAILLGADGGLAEASSSNLFIRRDATLITPPLSSGCLPGTVRAMVLAFAKEEGMDVVERRIDLQDLKYASEAFLTNALRGIQPINGVEGYRFLSEQRDFAQKIWDDLPSYPREKAWNEERHMPSCVIRTGES